MKNNTLDETLQDLTPDLIRLFLQLRDLGRWNMNGKTCSLRTEIPETDYTASIAVCHDRRHSFRVAVGRGGTVGISGTARMQFLFFSDDEDEIAAWLQTPEACQQIIDVLKEMLEKELDA